MYLSANERTVLKSQGIDFWCDWEYYFAQIPYAERMGRFSRIKLVRYS